MLRKLLITAAVLITANMMAFSQSGTLKGKITDKGTNEPIPFANIIIEQGGKQSGGTTSDFDGNFTIKPIPPGKYDVKASYVGYKPIMITNLVVVANQITFQDVQMESTAINIETFEVVDYKVPLISKDQTSSGGTMTSEEISKMPGRSAQSVAITVGGVFSQDGSMGSIRGARSDGTITYVDGVKVRGSSAVPKAAIEQVTVITGGTPAQYGDATGGILSISTKGASREFGMGFEGTTSQFLDKFGYNMLALNVQGPLIKGRDSTKTTALLGYFIAAEYTYEKDPRPFETGNWKALDDVVERLEKNPLVPTGKGQGTYTAGEFLRNSDLENIPYKLNAANNDLNLSGKIDVRTSNTTNLTFGGTWQSNWGKDYIRDYSLLNWKKNPGSNYNSWRAYGRFTQRFNTDANSKATIKNVFYSIQGDYSKTTNVTQDPEFKDDLFKYGYVGKMKTYSTRSFEKTYIDSIGSDVYVHNGFADTLVTFEQTDINPILSNYTQNYYDLYAGAPDFHYRNIDQIQLGGGLINGVFLGRDNVYGLWTNVGIPYNYYGRSEATQFGITANASADIGNHAIQLGFYYEQRNDRYITYNPVGLWQALRQQVNKHIIQLDLNNPHFAEDENHIFMDTIWYDRLYSASEQSLVDYNLRQKLGLQVDGTDWIDIDSYEPSTFTIDMFSADELLNGGNAYVGYRGYDHTGKKTKGRPSFDDFFTKKDANGRFTRPIGAFEPIYIAGYIQDKFAFNDLIFNVGLRLDRYDANQKVLKDPYLLYEAKTVKEVTDLGPHPTNMGEDYVVYVDNIKNPTAVKGYRSGSTWYNATGTEISDPSAIETSSGIAPYLVNPDQKEVNSSAFTDYDPQLNFMPRISFSFPISDEALFFAHYDVLTQRPSEGNVMNPTQYFFIYTQGQNAISNPNLRSEKTIDYELGFQQKLSNSSSIKISAYYREQRNMIQVYRYSGAYPVSYISYNNIDFGTVQGFTGTYDLRRTGNIWLKASYTLQFASGTGSNSESGLNLIRANQPNLRTITPLDFDRRHSISAVIDYRYGEGKEYNGPKITRKIKGTDKVKVIQLLKNTGLNVSINGGSGIPYSRSSTVVGTQVGSGTYSLLGQINGSRMPWQFRVDARLDKDIIIKTGKKGEKSGRPLFMNIYLEVLNVLNSKNVLSVYRATGNPGDDGYLTSADFQAQILAQTDSQAYIDQYSIKVNNPYYYSLPRRIRLGLSLAF
ncbi:MAG TPA: carboxypeptidase regulatory-like domain-containing protein [Bacteroidales bacterium]|nr:carboxypeptidase regulatory-like domain-containing protein [Bacteroidales bacterium]HPS26044.1 carboxypeptidase regulatory-like domain-containing protein [Bacteroidales bacterium]